ncbi:amidase [Streptosporangium jomthongense]|uniref:Amidase n=1 Tax=Marinobacter aromaticivorans TaxID=1494078 RepID=A0ABW2IUS7_9GAMM|nr:amidase [Marinobacter aromaticivorans]GGE63299.1 amidase [Streptosporangium jomthongense]
MNQKSGVAHVDLASETLSSLLEGIHQNRWRASGLLEICQDNMDRYDDPANQVYTARFDRTAEAEAAAIDTLRKGNVPLGELAGLPIALKVLFDVAGEVTHSGSKWWKEPARSDALIVSRLRRAGAVITGHTNMTEFAYSGLGLNPHYGTPANPLAPGRISGGSSSGAASAVAHGMAVAAIGSDTGGSVRIPAAFCGLVGFKPSQKRIPRDGSFPLSDSLDSIGPIARSVECCARLDAVMAGESWQKASPVDLRDRRFVVPANYMLDDVSAGVAEAFARSLRKLRDSGAVIVEAPVPVLDELPGLMEGGGLTAAESYHIHREWLQQHSDEYDPRVRTRMERGAAISAADYIELLRRRAERKRQADEWLASYDGLLAPTVPVEPPRLKDLENDAEYARLNLLILRNPTVANLLDLCAISLPNHRSGDLPGGLMLIGRNGTDRALLGMAEAMEKALQQ